MYNAYKVYTPERAKGGTGGTRRLIGKDIKRIIDEKKDEKREKKERKEEEKEEKKKEKEKDK